METIDWNAARFYFDVLSAIFMVGVAIYVWWTTRTRANSNALDDVHDRLDEMDRHVTTLRQALDSRPSYTEINALRAELSEINSGMSRISAQMQSTSVLLDRLHDYLLADKGNAR